MKKIIMLKVNQEEKERILKLHSIVENAQNDRTLEFIDVKSRLSSAFHFPGTDVNYALKAFQRANPAKFDDIIRELMKETTKIDKYYGLTAALNGEYGYRNKVDLDNINKVFVDNNSRFMLGYDVRGNRSVKNIKLILNPKHKEPQTSTPPQPSTVKKTVPTEVQNITKQIQKALSMKETGTMDQQTINKAYEIISKL